MNLRPKRQEEPGVNITPLIDVVFLMLIFFMVSTTFQKESVVKIDLPKASTQEEEIKEFFRGYMDEKPSAKDVIRLSLERLEINARMRASLM